MSGGRMAIPRFLQSAMYSVILSGKDSTEVIARRLEEAQRECSLAGRYAYNIVNDDVERAALEFAAIMDKERAKRK